MDGDVVRQIVSGVVWIGDDVYGGELGAVHNLQAGVDILINHYRHPLGVEEDSGDLAGGVVALLDGLSDLVLRDGAATPRMC